MPASRSTDTTFDKDLLNDGLTLSLVGMGVVFAVLALLALSIKGISLFDSEPSPDPIVETSPAQATEPAEFPGKISGQQIAAIVVAMALSEGPTTSIPSSISKAVATSDSWLQSGRMRVLGSGSPTVGKRRN